MTADFPPNITSINHYFYKSDGSSSSCSDNASVSSSTTSISSVGSNGNGNSNPSSSSSSSSSALSKNFFRPKGDCSGNNAFPRNIRLPARGYRNNPKNISIDIPIPSPTANMSPVSRLPSPPGGSPLSQNAPYIRKRRHSAGEVMDLTLAPARRGIVHASGSATPEELLIEPPMAPFRLNFARSFFNRDLTPTIAADEDDTMEQDDDDNDDEDEEYKEMEGDLDFDSLPPSPLGSSLFSPGEPTEPHADHPTHLLHPLENELQCSICNHLMVAPHGILCGHSFCGLCLSLWIDGNKTDCPECHANVIRSPRSMFPIYKLDGAIEIIARMILNEDEMKQRRGHKNEWLQYYHEHYPPPLSSHRFCRAPTRDTNRSTFESEGIRHYSALVREQCTRVLRGFQEGSAVSPTAMTPKQVDVGAVTPKQADTMTHEFTPRSQPILIPKGLPRSTDHDDTDDDDA